MFNVEVDTPFLSADEYARRSGIKRSVVVRLCREGELPTKPRANENAPFYINNALLIRQALGREY